MMVLQAFDITKEYQGTPILTGVTFHVAHGERVGLVGANGSGKSTLMKILAGESEPTGGAIHWVHGDLSRAYLSQDGDWEPDLPLSEQIGDVPADLLSRCGVSQKMLRQKVATLSGGQKTRAALARVLAGRPGVLLLDEPTNNLDTDGLQWLEELLVSYRGAVLVVSHDRFFLDKVATRILEMNDGKVRSYPGNYSAYAALKRAEQERHEAEYAKYLKEKKHLEAAIQRQIQWAMNTHFEKPDRTMDKFQKGYNNAQGQAHLRQASSMQKRLEKIKVEKPRYDTAIHLKLASESSTGRNLALARNLGFSFDQKRWLFRHADFYLQRGDRLAIVGPNGAGKTTLVRLLLGQLSPTEGTLYCSPLRVAYLAQEMETLNPTNTVLEEASGGNGAMDQAEIRTLLGCLLFSGETILKRVAVLSGGEKMRLALGKILLSNPDMLVLDEPTNGLDLPSRERVEEALEGYSGTLVMVSHDRYLLRRISTRVLSVKGGKLELFHGTYGEFVSRSDQPDEDRALKRLVLETRLARLAAQLDHPPEGEVEQLTDEFIRISREVRALRG